MRLSKPFSASLLLLGATYGTFTTVQAGAIQGITLVPGSPAALGAASSATNDPNDFVNNFPVQPGIPKNTVGIGKFMRGNPVDLSFSVVDLPVAGVTRYVVNETVANNTKLTWTDFQFQLGYFSGNKFVVSSLLDGLDFDVGITAGKEDPTKPFAPNPVSNMFAQNDNRANPNILTFTKGVVGPTASVNFSFVIDVPDFNKNIPAGAATVGGYNFTLRELYSVPEPASVILLGTGILAVLAAPFFNGRNKKKAAS
jgi:hypothetical protein